MKIKYEALRLLLAGTALILTAMLSTPQLGTLAQESHSAHKVEKLENTKKTKKLASKKSKSGLLWAIENYRQRR